MSIDSIVFGYSCGERSFKEMLRVEDRGLSYKASRQINWSDIVGYRAFPDFLFDLTEAFFLSAKPRLRLYLRDGAILTIRGDLLCVPGDTGGHQVAFDQLMEHVSRHLKKWQGPREEVVLLAMGWVLLLLGATGGAAYALWSRALPVLGTAVVIGVLVSQLAFAIGPLVARRARRLYINACRGRNT